MRLKSLFPLTLLCLFSFFLSSCVQKTTQNNAYISRNEELDFIVQNTTKKVLYITCFFYRKKEYFTRWSWDKSDIYRLDPGAETTIDIDTIPDLYDREETYGYLAVFENEHEAQDAIYELLDDNKKIDLDLLHLLRGKKVIIRVERYGFKGEYLDPQIIEKDRTLTRPSPELDFFIENQTGKTLFVTCFVYEKEKDDPVWNFDKTPIIRLKQGETKMIDVDTIISTYDYTFVRGDLAIFDEGQEDDIKNATYELLKPENKIKLGALFALKNKKIVLEVERYGVEGDSINYTTKRIRKIDFKQLMDRSKRKQPRGHELQVWR